MFMQTPEMTKIYVYSPFNSGPIVLKFCLKHLVVLLRRCWLKQEVVSMRSWLNAVLLRSTLGVI